MRIEYTGLSEINSSLIALDDVSGVAYDELAEITLRDGSRRHGRDASFADLGGEDEHSATLPSQIGSC